MAHQPSVPVSPVCRPAPRRRTLGLGLALVLLLALAAVGCGKDSAESGTASSPQQPTAGQAPAPAGQAPAPDDIAAKAARYYQLNCRNCHGETGRGDGAGAATFNPKPRDYSDPAWQAQITDQQIKDILIQGGAPLGKSGLMQPRPDLARKPELLDALVALVRSFGRK